MSTKTSIKRIALVAAAALALGGFSAVSASAQTASQSYLYCSKADGGAIANSSTTGDSCTGVAGDNNTVTVTGVQTTKDMSLTISGAGATFNAATNYTLNATGTKASVLAANAAGAITVNTPTVGTITIVISAAASGSGIYTDTTERVTITVAAAKASGVFSAAKSTFLLASGETTTLVTADAAVTPSSVTVTETASATIQVHLADSLGAGYGDTLTATIISGPAIISGTNDSTTANSTWLGTFNTFKGVANTYSVTASTIGAATGEYRDVFFGIYANGQVGKSVIAIKNTAGTVLATKEISFAGTVPASMVVTVKKANVLNTGTTAKAIKVNLYDAVGGNEIKSYAGTISGAVATGSTVGTAITSCSAYSTDGYYCSVAPGAAVTATADGTETYSLKTSDGTATGTAKISFVSGVVKTVAIAGPASADPGSKVVVTLTATGANGSALPDGAYSPGALLKAADPVANASLTAQPFGAAETITIAAGVATSYTYAPYGGTLSLSWTLAGTAATASSAAVVGSNAYFTAAGFSTTSAAAAVAMEDVAISSNTEATAAANAATDAANQAADAADNATQAAAEALAAVNTLATTVATLIAGIKNQIKALNTLILAIKKKVNA